MRIIVKIGLTIAVIIVAVIFQAIVSETGNSNTGMVRLIPGAIMVFGIIGVWGYKPKKNNSENTDLDKTI